MTIKDFATFKTMEGTTLPPGDWITVTQEMINSFADATKDFQWIHVDVERANKESPFGAPIAHGFMSVSLLSKMIEEAIMIEEAKMGVNYGLNKVRFPHPVLVNSELRLRVTIAKIEDYKTQGYKVTWDCTVEINGKDKPACVGEFLTLLF